MFRDWIPECSVRTLFLSNFPFVSRMTLETHRHFSVGNALKDTHRNIIQWLLVKSQKFLRTKS